MAAEHEVSQLVRQGAMGDVAIWRVHHDDSPGLHALGKAVQALAVHQEPWTPLTIGKPGAVECFGSVPVHRWLRNMVPIAIHPESRRDGLVGSGWPWHCLAKVYFVSTRNSESNSNHSNSTATPMPVAQVHSASSVMCHSRLAHGGAFSPTYDADGILRRLFANEQPKYRWPS